MSEHSAIVSQAKTIVPAAEPQLQSVDTEPAQEMYKQDMQVLPIQFKLAIGAPDDPLEEEADTMADTIMHMPEQSFIQRKCSDCEEEEKLQRKPLASFIQRKESSAGNTVVSETVSGKINASKGSGSSMDSLTG